MKNKLEDLRDHLFETLEALKDKENPMDLDRAKTIGLVADRLIESAKVEVDAMRITRRVQSSFFPMAEVSGPGAAAITDKSKTQ